MTITATCSCKAQIQAPDQLAGRSVKCPKCKASVPIPAGDGLPGAGSGPTPGSGYGGNAGGAAYGQAPTSAARQSTAPGGFAAQGSPQQANFREDGDIDSDLKEKMRSELGPSEQIVWMGKPVPSVIFMRHIGILIVGFILAGGGIYLVTSGTKEGAILILMGVVVTLIPIMQWKKATRTCYALTNRRALVLAQGLFGFSRQAYSPAEVAKMQRHSGYSGVGDLVFQTVTTVTTTYTSGNRMGRKAGMETSTQTTRYGFIAIERIDEVERLVRETLIDRFADRLTDGNSF